MPHTPMKASELISILSQDPEKPVVLAGYEDGFIDVKEVRPIKLILNANTSWCYGPHEESENGDVDAILIGPTLARYGNHPKLMSEMDDHPS